MKGLSQEEKEYLAAYNIANYERPSVAADIVVLSVMEEEKRSNIRKQPKRDLKVLLVKRGKYPFQNSWAMPGGFCRPNEDVIDTARRELYEETNVENAYLTLVGVFGEAGRDPRGWIISNTFLALIDGNQYQLRAGTDAWEAAWFGVTLEVCPKEEATGEQISEYLLTLTNEELDIKLTARVQEKRRYLNYHEQVSYAIVEQEGLAFDHGKIIVNAILQLREEVEHDAKRAFDLLPEYFTMNMLQNVNEIVLDRPLLTPNFRRKNQEYVIETEQMLEGEGFRPAKLFKRNLELFH